MDIEELTIATDLDNQKSGEVLLTRQGFVDMQICVPKNIPKDDLIKLAEKVNPCGTTHGWRMRKEGDEYLQGAPERMQCSVHEANEHIVFDA